MENFNGSVEFVISNRLHCLLIAAMHGAVPIALISREHDKIRGLFDTVGWQDLLVYSDDPSSLKARLQMNFAGRHQLICKIGAPFKQQRELAGQFMNRSAVHRSRSLSAGGLASALHRAALESGAALMN